MSAPYPSFSSTSYSPDQLIAGGFPLITEMAVLDTGVVVRGHVLGKVTATGKLIISLAAAGDGSQTPYAIALEGADATGGDKNIVVALSGEFNEDKLTLGAGHTLASIRDGLRDKGIYLKAPVPAA